MSAAGLLQVGATLLLNAGFAWLGGSLLARRWLAGAHAPLLERRAWRLRQGETWAGLACLCGSLLCMWAATALMADVALSEAVGMLPMVLLHTGYGQAGLAAIAAAGMLLLAPRAARLPLLLLFALVRASVSHASDGHGLFSMAVGVEWLHLLLMGVWLGSVGVSAWLVLPDAAPPGAYLATLSKVATLALAGIVASGAFNVWQRLDTPGQLLGTPFGQALTVKLALFAVALLLGAYNRFAGFPRALAGQGAAALLVLRIESLVLLGALACAAVLTSLPPPG